MVVEKKFGAKTGEGYYKWDRPFLEKMNQKRGKGFDTFFNAGLRR